MFALSTNNNNPLNTIAMNKVFTSVFAAVFAFCSTAAFASPTTDALNTTVQSSIETTDVLSMDNGVTMRISVILPDGSTTRKKGTYTSMGQALVAYHQYVDGLPRGSKIGYVEFTDDAGNILFSYQG